MIIDNLDLMDAQTVAKKLGYAYSTMRYVYRVHKIGIKILNHIMFTGSDIAKIKTVLNSPKKRHT